MTVKFLIYLFIGIFFAMIVGAVIVFFVEFFQELRFINEKIQYYSGQEQQYWLQRRRKLWLSLLPFVKY